MILNDKYFYIIILLFILILLIIIINEYKNNRLHLISKWLSISFKLTIDVTDNHKDNSLRHVGKSL